MRVTKRASKIGGMVWMITVCLIAVVCNAAMVLAQSISADDLQYTWELPMAPGESLMIDEAVTTSLTWETDSMDGTITVQLGEAMPPGMQLSVHVKQVSPVSGTGCGEPSFGDFMVLSYLAPLEIVTGIDGSTCTEGEAQLEFKLEVVDWEQFRGDLNEESTLEYEYVI